MVQGGLSETTRRCGNRRSEGKSRALYVPHEHADQARQAQAAWKEFWEVACALAAENREQLRERMQGQESAAERRKANG